MSDQQITCSECGGVFVFTEAEQQFYETKGLAAPPKRCKACRQARRAAREGGAGPDNARGAGGGFGGGGGGFGGGAPRGGGGGGGGFGGRPGAAPRRFSNDANEYRAPMNGGGPGDRGPGGPPRAGGFNARGPRPARPGFGPAQGGGGGGFRGGNGQADARPAFNRPDDRPRGNFNGPAQGGQGEYRGPARDRGQWGTSGGPGQGAGAGRGPGGNGGNERPRRPERDFNAPRPERVVTPPSDDPRQTRPKAERPRFDITCAECGTQSQVPFKPLEGRQVFCQACYRARKGTNAAEAGAVETSEAPEADLGIVE